MENLDIKNPGTNCGWTPLHEAAKNGKIEAYKIILSLNIDKNPKISIVGDTILHIAARYGQLDVCKLISICP